MRIELNKSPFLNQGLAIETSGYFKGAKLFQNGELVTRKNGKFTLRTEDGSTVEVKLLTPFYDPIPRLKIGEETIEFAPRLKWYELTWILLPCCMLFAFGAIGGFGGAVASLNAGKLFRGNRSTLAKYAISGFSSIGIILVTVSLAVTGRALIESFRN
jgi:hypothetical protein